MVTGRKAAGLEKICYREMKASPGEGTEESWGGRVGGQRPLWWDLHGRDIGVCDLLNLSGNAIIKVFLADHSWCHKFYKVLCL